MDVIQVRVIRSGPIAGIILQITTTVPMIMAHITIITMMIIAHITIITMMITARIMITVALIVISHLINAILNFFLLKSTFGGLCTGTNEQCTMSIYYRALFKWQNH